MSRPLGLAITENQIVEAVVKHLKMDSWVIIQALTTQEQGDDIVAKKNNDVLYIEAKGGTSADSRTKRFGKTFTDNQAKDHIAKAICKVSEAITDKPNSLIGIAIPNEEYHWRYVRKIKGLFTKAKIKIYWVDGNLNVTEEVF